MACPVRLFDRCVCVLSAKTFIYLSINVTDSHEHFHFCIKVCPDCKIPNECRAGAYTGASDRRNTEGDTKIHCAELSEFMNLRFKSQHAVWIFYESRNFKGITACNCLNISIIRSITAFYRIKKWHVTVIKVNVCSCRTFLTCRLTRSLYLYYYLHF